MENFVKKGEISLVNGGYLVVTKDEKPINNVEFVKAQLAAHRIVVTAKLAEGRDFKGIEAASLDKLRADVDIELSKKNIEYVPLVKVSKGSLNEQLIAEGLAWHNGNATNYQAEVVNKFMAEFDAISEFEEFGMVVENTIVKLPTIYTIAEITEAVKAYIKLF